MSFPDGKRRVVISNVKPQVEEGAYPAKAVVQEMIPITAAIFADGHDELSACVQIRMGQGKKWLEYAMKPKGNDRWVFHFTPEQTGIYQFVVYGWVDHFASWQKSFSKKMAAWQ